MQKAVVFRIMIASPNDVARERKEVEAAIYSWNSNNTDRTGVILQPLTWEIDVSRGAAADAQSLIDEQLLEKSDMVIGIFWKRLGRRSPDAISYTVGELKKHIDMGKQVSLFFKRPPVPKSADQAKEIQEVLDFKENITKTLGKGCIYSDFKGLSDFNIYRRLEKDVSVHLLPLAPKTESKDSSLLSSNVQSIFNPIVFFNQNERPAETRFYETVKDAKKFYFMARTGVTFLTRYTTTILDALKRGCECKFLILNKDSEIIRIGRFETAFDEKNASLALDYLVGIKRAFPDKVQIHLCDFYPTFDIEYFESLTGNKRILVQTHFIASHLGPDRPMFMLEESNFWYQIFWDEWEQMWQKTMEWKENIE